VCWKTREFFEAAPNLFQFLPVPEIAPVNAPAARNSTYEFAIFASVGWKAREFFEGGTELVPLLPVPEIAPVEPKCPK